MRGEFIRGDGLVIPNSISTPGANELLRVLFHNIGFTMRLGLCSGIPNRAGLHSSLQEPTIGVGGYLRQNLTRTEVHWPTLSSIDGVAYAETSTVTFPATDVYSHAVDRIMFTVFATLSPGDFYISLSEAFPAPILISPATPLASRQFKYRLYLG